MKLKGGGIARSITVRKIASGVGVERTFMVNSPRIEKIEVVRHGLVRRAQLYFLRKRVGKAATLRERRTRADAPRGRARLARPAPGGTLTRPWRRESPPFDSSVITGATAPFAWSASTRSAWRRRAARSSPPR